MDHPPARVRGSRAIERNAMEPAGERYFSSAPTYVEIDTGGTTGDELRKWLDYWNLITFHKRALVFTMTCGVALALLVSLVQTPVYVASTTLEIQGTERQPFEAIAFLNRSDPSMLQTQVQLLRSRTLQDRVSAALATRSPKAALSSSTGLGRIRDWLRLNEPPGPSAWQSAVASARGSLTITLMRDTPIVQIATESTMAQAATDYVNTLAEVFIDHNREERWSLYQTTGVWLERAQEELKTKLEESEKQLVEYATGSGLVLSSNSQNIGEQTFLNLQTELTKAQADRIAKEAAYRTAVSRPGQSPAETLDGGIMGAYEIKIADLRRELAELTIALTEAHPKVQRLRVQVEELESAQARERNNIINRLRTAYDADVRREQELRAELETQSKVLSEQDVKLVRYKMLQREVETYRKIYETTLQAGKEAGVASALRPVNARLIDAARVSAVPSSPNLLRNLAIGTFGSLVFGVAMIMIRERADRSIRQPGALPQQFRLRELGVIPSASADETLSLGSGRKRHFLLEAVASPTLEAPRDTTDSVELAMWHRKSSHIAESFRATVTSILLSRHDGHDKRVILVTSPSPKEGKSTV